jgi:anti-anti-sigma regulatory factor
MSSRITSRSIPKAACLLLTPAAGTYGSIELSALDELAASLAACGCAQDIDETVTHVIVDLSLISVGGSGLLGVLAQFRQQLAVQGRTLSLCGDQTGLLRKVGWNRLLPLFETLYEALEHAGQTHAARSVETDLVA